MTMQTFYGWLWADEPQHGAYRTWLLRVTRATLAQVQDVKGLRTWEFWGTAE